MEKTKATSILNDIMEKLSLVKKDEVKEIEIKDEVQLSEQVKEEDEMSQKLTELACNKEVQLEEAVSEEQTEEVNEELSEEVSLDDDKYVSRDEFDSTVSELKGLIDEMKLGYEDEKISMSKEIEKLSAQPAAEPINHNPQQIESNNQFVRYANNRGESTIDRVMNILANN